jgi:WS/DGAT/MGAT family acyltransferase
MGSVKFPRLAPRMKSRDAGFLYLERRNALLHIGCVAVLDGPLCLDALCRHVEARLHSLHRYTQRAVSVPFSLGHPTWEDDPRFDLRNHLHRWALPDPGGQHELKEMVARLLEQPLDRGLPLWEMHLIEGLDGGRTALFQKVHHCMIDGLAGAQLLEHLLDTDPSARDLPPTRDVVPPVPGFGERVGRAVVDALLDRTRAALRLVDLAWKPTKAREAVGRLRDAAWSAVRLASADVPTMPWNAAIGARRVLHFTRLPMEGVRSIRLLRGGTVNDVVLTVLAGGLHRYLRSAGLRTRGLELTALVPVSLRSAAEANALGNRISAMLVPLAVDPSHEVPRLAATRAVTDRLKKDGSWAGIDALLGALDELPAPLVAAFGRSMSLGRLANLIATNVPGPRESRYLCRVHVDGLYPIVPIIDGIGLGIAVFSYDGALHIGLNADAELVPDVEKLGQGVEEAFCDLLSGS